MSPKRRDQMSIEDIKFLEAVLKIQRAVEAGETDGVPDTETGEGPVNITAISRQTELSKFQLKYRMKGADDDGRGFGMDDLGYIRIYEPKPVPERGGFSPRSCEITEKGMKALRAAKEELGMVTDESDAVDSEVEEVTKNQLDIRVENLRDEMEEVSSQLDRLEAQMQQIQESATGALDPSIEENLELLSKHYQGVSLLFQEALGVDASDFADMDRERAREYRPVIASALHDGDTAEGQQKSSEAPEPPTPEEVPPDG